MQSRRQNVKPETISVIWERLLTTGYVLCGSLYKGSSKRRADKKDPTVNNQKWSLWILSACKIIDIFMDATAEIYSVNTHFKFSFVQGNFETQFWD